MFSISYFSYTQAARYVMKVQEMRCFWVNNEVLVGIVNLLLDSALVIKWCEIVDKYLYFYRIFSTTKCITV